MPDRPPLDVALVIPVYNERDNLPLLIDEITHAVGGTGRRYEIVAVDDASTDGSLDVLRGLERDHPELRVVALAEHAGQTAALAAGFRAACSRVVVTLDADLQNDPDEVRHVEPRLPIVRRRAGRALDAASGPALPDPGGAAVMHDDWLKQIEQELDGELSLPERAALARHLAGCRHCAEARVSHIEMRVAFARSAGQPHAHTVPRPAIRGRTLGLWMIISLIDGAAAGWFAHVQWGGPGPPSLEATRALFVAQ